MIVDSVAAHLAEARTIDRAAVPTGMFVAWCANLQLLAPAFEEEASALVLRVRYREITGSELLVAGCGGELVEDHLTAEGAAFARRYYPHYLDDFRRVFGDAIYDVKDDWAHYDRIAPVLTDALMGGRRRARRRWWHFWK